MNIVVVANNAVPTVNNYTFEFPVQRTTVLESNIVNPNFLRTFMLSQDGLKITQGNTQVGYKLIDLLNTAIALYPALTWPPVFTTNPVNMSVANNNATSFNVAVSSEITVNYQWQGSNSIDLGANWTNIASSGVYTNTTTNHIDISNTFNLGNNWYRCFAYSAAGNANSRYAILTVI